MRSCLALPEAYQLTGSSICKPAPYNNIQLAVARPNARARITLKTVTFSQFPAQLIHRGLEDALGEIVIIIKMGSLSTSAKDKSMHRLTGSTPKTHTNLFAKFLKDLGGIITTLLSFAIHIHSS